jgi:uncharacterized protein YbgA (DUF1722 family)/uncharacterized protein YbbK (DUF523 family)
MIHQKNDTMKKPRLGISTCLLGENVRYDGGHKLDRFLRDTLGAFVEYVPVCPEVECGFPTPREAFHLEGDPKRPRLCGFIFKSGSPSSGMERVKVRNEKGMPEKKGQGIFARIFMEHFPLLPVEEEGRLHDMDIRENFIERIFTLMRWKETLTPSVTMGKLVDFHTRHKMLILSHNQQMYREMGRLVANSGDRSGGNLYERYGNLLMTSLKYKSTPRKNSNVLMHALGYFKKTLSSDEKQEMIQVIDTYRLGLTPLIVPITLLNHYVRKYDQPYLSEQVFLNPHPLELQLRNHV